MSFHSLEYALFFVVVFLVFWGLQRFGIGKLVFLTIMSWGFYATESPWGLVLLLIATFVDFFVALKMDAEEDKARRRRWLMVSIVSNLSLLGYFKYANFFQETVVDVANVFGAHLQFMRWDIFLPAGISFYTFMTLSYTVDVYRREIPVERNFVRFAFFIGFFAHLLAGPIVRARDLLPQIPKRNFLSSQQVSRALWLIALGVAKKIVVADPLERDIIERVFQTPHLVTGADTLVGLIAYSARIYYDFSAYSDMAIGSALLLGYHLPDNFDRPYAATSISNFWRRWHMTMSSFLRDYVYFPLGGARGAPWKVYRNLFVTFFLIGLWHGASWNFALYGTGHALAMCFHRWLRKRGPDPALPFAFGLASLVAVIGLAVGLRLSLGPGLTVLMMALGFVAAVVLGLAFGKKLSHPDRVGRSLGAAAFGIVFGGVMASLFGLERTASNVTGVALGVALAAGTAILQAKSRHKVGPTIGFGAIGLVAGTAIGFATNLVPVLVILLAVAGALLGGAVGWMTTGEPALDNKPLKDDETPKLDPWGVTWRVGLTLTFVIFMRVLFRAAEIEHGQLPKTSAEAWNVAAAVTNRFFTGPWNQVTVGSTWLWVVLIGSYVIHLTPRKWMELTWVGFRSLPFVAQGALLAVIILCIAAFTDGRPLPFAYVQF